VRFQLNFLHVDVVENVAIPLVQSVDCSIQLKFTAYPKTCVGYARDITFRTKHNSLTMSIADGTRDDGLAKMQAMRLEIAAHKEREAAANRRANDEREREKVARKALQAAMKREKASKRLAQASMKRANLSRRRAIAAIQRADSATQLSSGNFYSPIERVWIKNARSLRNDPCLFEEMRREKAPKKKERRQVGTQNSYTLTLKEAAPNRLNQVADVVVSVSKKDEKEMWPTDIRGSPSLTAGMAYLVPPGNDCASTYSDVARCVLGLPDDAREDIQQTIHGSLNDQGARIPGTGIKHSPDNKIRLCCQSEYFDNDPCVLIVPIMTLKQMKEWDHGEYSAIVLAGGYEDVSAALTYRAIQMTELGALATPAEIETARQSLAQVVEGLAYSLVHRQEQRQENLLDPAMRTLLDSFRTGLQTSDGVRVDVPKASGNDNFRVRKVTFRAHASACFRRRASHVAPDPLLLVIKSAINWSWRHGQQLLVTGEQPEDEGENDSSGEE
jgi:hypothetical protein